MSVPIRFASILLVVAIACACDAPSGSGTPTPKYGSAAEQLLAEFEGNADTAVVDKVVELAKRVTLETRTSGIRVMVQAIQAQAGAYGMVDATPVNDVEDFTLGQTLPGVGEYVGPKVEELVPAGNPNKKYYECPPIETEGHDSCVQIVDAILAKVKGAVDVTALQNLVKQMFEEDPALKGQSQDFKDFALGYLDDLALDIHKLGIHAAAVRAEYALRKAGKCDNVLIDGGEIAKLRGIEEGEQIIRDLVNAGNFKLAPQGQECLQIGPKGAATEAKIKAAVEAYLAKDVNLMCPDMSKDNTVVQQLDKLRKEGIQRAIDAHTTTIMIGIFRNGKAWKVTEVVVADIDGCEAKDQVQYTTSPLVLDLDGDGLDLTLERVRFDLRATGQPQMVTWTGKREGFLALDLNGDGRITSGRELFGDRSRCNLDRCADGAAALAVYDEPAKGGNGDGRIDASDTVFGSLKIWVDSNHDGKSQASELNSLRDNGITSLSLQATRLDRKVMGGRLSLSLQVETDRGARTAYDVWFDNLASPGFQAPLR
jgi:hypothetical protein